MNVSQVRTSLVVLAVTAGVSTFSATSAFAYARHEHPFLNRSFSGMTQAQADRWCNVELQKAFRKNSGVVMASDRKTRLSQTGSPKVWHIWAHLNNRQCIANQ